MKIEKVKINKLKKAEYNPRKISDNDFEQLKKSLKKFGFVEPLVVNNHSKRKNVIIGGHQRLKAWEELGNEEVPVFYVKLSIEKEKELNVRLNKNTGEFDFDILRDLFDKESLLEWGFEDFEIPDSVDIDTLFENEEEAKEKEPKIITCPECGHKWTN